MPAIEIRPVIASDISTLSALEATYTSEYVWQMEVRREREAGKAPGVGDGQTTVNFRQVRLPRPVRVEHPRSPRTLASDWTRRSGILVALLNAKPIGYVSLMLEIAPKTTWATDLVVDRSLRRQGIGSTLVLAALEWAANMDTHTLVLEMQPKNHPAIMMAHKLGFEFCGFNDRFYPNREIGIFFAKSFYA
jgi:ribosomal protein S18 acetylase RimI-like enzyme